MAPLNRQSIMPSSTIKKETEHLSRQAIERRRISFKYGDGASSGVLGYDEGYNFSEKSEKGLPRKRRSVLEPVIMNTGAFTRVELDTGVNTSDNGFRSIYDPLRNDEDFSRNKRPRFGGDGRTLTPLLANQNIRPLV